MRLWIPRAEQEARVLAALTDHLGLPLEMTLSEICAVSGMGAGRVSATLARLESERRIRSRWEEGPGVLLPGVKPRLPGWRRPRRLFRLVVAW